MVEWKSHRPPLRKVAHQGCLTLVVAHSNTEGSPLLLKWFIYDVQKCVAQANKEYTIEAEAMQDCENVAKYYGFVDKTDLNAVKTMLSANGITCREFPWSDGRKFLYVQLKPGEPFRYTSQNVIKILQDQIANKQGLTANTDTIRDAALLLAMECWRGEG